LENKVSASSYHRINFPYPPGAAGGDLEMQGFNDCIQGAPKQLQVERRVFMRRGIQQKQPDS
jgi:hypothetical protein